MNWMNEEKKEKEDVKRYDCKKDKKLMTRIKSHEEGWEKREKKRTKYKEKDKGMKVKNTKRNGTMKKKKYFARIVQRLNIKHLSVWHNTANKKPGT